MPRPDRSTVNGVLHWIETTLDESAARQPNPGRPAIHRMNRVEYANAVRDLLGLEIAGDTMLPADSQGFGFDNNADLLTMSPVLMDRYMLAARKIARLAIGDPAMRPVVETYTVSRLLTQRDRMSEDLPFGSRGGLSVRHHFFRSTPTTSCGSVCRAALCVNRAISSSSVSTVKRSSVLPSSQHGRLRRQVPMRRRPFRFTRLGSR
jgi:hypothetical protein